MRVLRTAALLALLFPLCYCQASAPWKPRIVIMVAVDTCRADHLSCFGWHRATSPNIDRLAADGVLFKQAFSQSNESLFSYGAIMTGCYPRDLAPLNHLTYHVGGTPTLAALLAARGIQTAAFVAGGHLDRQFGFAQGFDRYEDQWSFGSFFNTFPPAFDALAAAARDGAPHFFFLHGYDLHEPYGKPMFFDHLFDKNYHGIAEKLADQSQALEHIYNGRYFETIAPDALLTEALRSTDVADYLLATRDLDPARGVALTPTDIDYLAATYDGAMAYADVWVGLLMSRIQALGLQDQTLVILFGDHGEELHEHGMFGHRLHMTEATLHVPLVLWGPGGLPRGRIVDQVVELRQMMATVLDYFGAPETPGKRAATLRPLIETTTAQTGACAVTEGLMPQACIRSDRYRLVYTGPFGETDSDVRVSMHEAPLDARHFALFDVRADPEQRHNLLDGAHVPESDARSLKALLLSRLAAQP